MATGRDVDGTCMEQIKALLHCIYFFSRIG